MKETSLIIARLSQTFEKFDSYGPSMEEGPFHGPSILESLEGVTFEEALHRPLDIRHTVWEIVNHISFWMEATRGTLRGLTMRDVETEEDWPGMGYESKDWDIDLKRLNESCRGLREMIGVLRDSDLERTASSRFKGNDFTYTYRKLLHGICDHNLYHAGQISILKKM